MKVWYRFESPDNLDWLCHNASKRKLTYELKFETVSACIGRNREKIMVPGVTIDIGQTRVILQKVENWGRLTDQK